MATIPALPNTTSRLAVPATSSEIPANSNRLAQTSSDASPTAQQTTTPLSHEELKHVMAQANEVLATTTSNQLHFSVDQATGAYVVKLVDQQTGKTLHQFPTEKMLAIAQAILDQKGGSLVNHEI